MSSFDRFLTSLVALKRRVVDNVVNFKKYSTPARRVIDAVFPDWVTPNMVTVGRGLLTIPIVWLALNGHFWTALVVFLVAALADFIDGALSEIRNLKTLFGSFVDPLADKLLVGGALLALVPRLHWVFGTVIVLICLNAVAIMAARVVKLAPAGTKTDHKKVAAKSAGKFKMLAEVASIALLYGGLALGAPFLVWTALPLLVVALVLGTFSLRSQL